MQILVNHNTITTTEFTPTKITRHTYYYWDKDIEVRGNRLVFPNIDKQHSFCSEVTKNPNDNHWYGEYGRVPMTRRRQHYSADYHDALLRFNGEIESDGHDGFSVRIPKGKMKDVRAIVDVIGTKYDDGGKEAGESIKFLRLVGENGKYYSLAQYKWADEWTDEMVEQLESIIGTKIQPHYTGSRVFTGIEVCSLDKKAMDAMGGWVETSLGLLHEGLWRANNFRDFEDIVGGTLLSS